MEESLRGPAWVDLARAGASLESAARTMRCSRGTARRRLLQAQQSLVERAARCDSAASLLLHSQSAKPEISRRQWATLALGIRREGSR